ncbi:MAG: ABC transporter permease [Acidobacteriota bacterium]
MTDLRAIGETTPSALALADALRRRGAPRRTSVIRPPSLSAASLLTSVRKLAQHRHLLWALSVHRIKVRYKQSVLGILWAILQPLSMMLIFTFLFSYVARMPSDGAPYALFAYTALLPWNFLSSAVSNSTTSLVSHSQFVTKVYFPREILPLSYVVASLFDFAVASTLLVGLLIHYRVPLTINALYAIPLMVVLSGATIGTAFLLAATNARFRDIGVAVPMLLQLWLYASPVIYPLSVVPQRFRTIYQLNPMVGVIENFRQVILRGAPPDVQSFAISAAVSVLLLVCAYIYFKWMDATMADFI